MGAAPLRALIGWVLVALTLLSSGCDRLGRPASSGQLPSQPLAPTAPRGALKEVAAPRMVQELRARLDRHDPQVTILAPADGALLPAGPWTLELQVQDWPLADAGPLGLGPHLVVELDNGPPQRITDAAAARHLAMAPLSPGSHRLTVYAARPWGEVVKAPGASRQIRLDRVAANPQQLPAPGSPQLLAALASPAPAQEPVLIDWLLLDAPLQHLRDDDGRWRLRVSINGDSFLVDRQTPLWLKGFHGGSNAVQLELLDGRGEPLNPPFNSLVEEVVIQPGPGAAWQRAGLTTLEQAQLLGEAPLAPEPQAEASPAPPPKLAEQRSALEANPAADPLAPTSAAMALAATEAAEASAPGLPAIPQAPTTEKASATDSLTAPGQGALPGSAAASQATAANGIVPAQALPPAPVGLANTAKDLPASPAAEQPREQLKTAKDSEETWSPDMPGDRDPIKEVQTAPATALPAASLDNNQASQAQTALPSPGDGDGAGAVIPAPIPMTPSASANGRPETLPAPNAPESSLPEANAATPTTQPPGRLTPSSSLRGRARDQVAADGSLLKPRPEGPLARLRQRFQP